MSKTSKRKSSESGKQNDNRTAPSSKDQGGTAVVKRQSVFERLGTKAASSGLSSERNLSVNTAIPDGFCRSWAQNGTCSFDKTCKLAHSHALISPSKRSSSIKKEELIISPLSRRQIEEEKNRLLSSIKHQSPDVSTWENWDQTELEYEDEKVLEKRRAALQRELELQMKKDGSRKEVVKARRSSSTSSLSSTSSVSSSSSSSSRSSVSVTKKTEDKKRRTSSSPEPDKKKLVMKGGSHKDSPPRKMSSASSRDVERAKGKSSASSPMRQPQSRKRSISPPRKPSPKTKGSDPYKGITLEVTLKNELALRANAARRKESPIRRGVSSDRRSRRSNSRNRRRSPVARSTVARRSRPRSPSRPSTSSRARTPERKKEDERKKDDRRDRKNDYRDKKESHDDSRGRGKTRDLREVAREKERFEALERCRERQREREQKEKERLREERERKDSKRSSRDISRGSTASSDKRPERYDRFDRGKGERDRSYERERVRDRALERMMERKSVERTRERSRERYADRGNYSESRRLLQPEEKPYASSPYRAGGERNRYDAERERLSPREERIGRGGYADDRRDRGRSRGWPDNQPASQPTRYEESGRERDKPRSSGDWAGDRGGDFPEPSGSRNREWDSSRVRDEGDDWSGYDRGAPPDWHNRPHALHHHIDDRRERRHGSGSKEKDPHTPIDSSKDKESVENIGKRPGPIDDNDEPVKRPRLSEPALEELSDISDDLDDILNQDDGPDGHDSRMGDSSAAINDTSSGQGERADAHMDDSSQASPNARMGDEENNMDGLDFEEISDEELEEELKVNKGGSVGDALGVDWASLVAECRPQKKKLEENGVSSVRARWEPAGILARVGVSSSLASPEYLKKLREKFPQLAPGISSEKETSPRSVLGMVALQRKMADRKEKRESIIAISMENKQALSARADIAIRRRLCGLPVVSLETYHTTGFCPWAV